MPRQSKYEKDHAILKSTGMFWEFHPELSGEWEKDKEAFIEYRKRCEKIARMSRTSVKTINK